MMMRRTLFYTLILFAITLLFPLQALAEDRSLKAFSNRNTMSIGEEFSVEVVAEYVSSIVGADLVLDYDSEKLLMIHKEYALSEEKFFDLQDINDRMQDENERVKIIFALKKGTELLTGDKIVIAKIHFRAKKDGIAEVKLSSQSKLVSEIGDEYAYVMLNTPAEAIKINIIRKGQISGNIQLSDQADFHTQISLLKNGQVIDRTFVDENGDYVIAGLEDGEYMVRIHQLGYVVIEENIRIESGNAMVLNDTLQRIKEDVNRDGVISLEDLVAIASRYELTASNEDWLEDADLNKDGRIDLLDILFVSRKLE